MTRFAIENDLHQRIEEGCRVSYGDGSLGVVMREATTASCVIVKADADGNEYEMHVDDLNKETSTKAHCHGCDRYTTQTVYPLEKPEHRTGRTFGWECNECRFINNGVHTVEERDGNLLCNDCCKTIPLRIRKN